MVVSAVARRLWGKMDERRAADDLDAWMMAGFPRSWGGAHCGLISVGIAASSAVGSLEVLAELQVSAGRCWCRWRTIRLV